MIRRERRAFAGGNPSQRLSGGGRRGALQREQGPGARTQRPDDLGQCQRQLLFAQAAADVRRTQPQHQVHQLLFQVKQLGSARNREARVTRADISDPYLIAYLRNGELEALRVATLSLVDRELIALGGPTVFSDKEVTFATSRHDASAVAKRPIERAVLDAFRTPGNPERVLPALQRDPSFVDYREVLEHAGCLPDEQQRRQRQWRMLSLAALLVILAAVKVYVGLTRDRSVLFLVVLAAGAVALNVRIAAAPWRTSGGDTLLRDLKHLVAGLADRASTIRPGGRNDDLAMLAAVFGLQAVSSQQFPYVTWLRPKRWTQRFWGEPDSDSGGWHWNWDHGNGGDGGDGCGGCGGD